MIERKKYEDYVCPFCFRSPENCICKHYSMDLILVDYNLQPIIKRLNDKGLKTRDCCEGHFGEKKPNIYISFIVPLKNFPIGFKKEGNFIIRHIYESTTEEEFEKEKFEMIKNLNKWIDEAE